MKEKKKYRVDACKLDSINNYYKFALMKTLQNLLVAAGIVLFLYSCNEDHEPELEPKIFNFPIELYPKEVSHISDARFFINGQEIFDTTACKSFMRSEWQDELFSSPRYDFFDKSDFLNTSFIPQRIIFDSKDTGIFRISSFDYPSLEDVDRINYYAVEWNNPFFIFHEIQPSGNPQTPMLKVNNYLKIIHENNDAWDDLQNNMAVFIEKIKGNTSAEGNYSELELNIVNFRYMQWRGLPQETFGSAARFINEINYNDIVNSMQETDTLVFQEFKVRYKANE